MKRKYSQDDCIMVEVCLPPNPAPPQHLRGEEISRDSAGSVSLRLTGLTIAQQCVYRASVYHPQRLTHFLLKGQDKAVFVFAKDFLRYTHEWSEWQSFDFATDDSNFFWLATRDVDRTAEATRLQLSPGAGPTARFKCVPFDEYRASIRLATDMSLDEGLPASLPGSSGQTHQPA
jgi:hypothetical protein